MARAPPQARPIGIYNLNSVRGRVGLRRGIKAPISPEARVRISSDVLLPFVLHTKRGAIFYGSFHLARDQLTESGIDSLYGAGGEIVLAKSIYSRYTVGYTTNLTYELA